MLPGATATAAYTATLGATAGAGGGAGAAGKKAKRITEVSQRKHVETGVLLLHCFYVFLPFLCYLVWV